MTALTLTLKYQCRHCHFPMNLRDGEGGLEGGSDDSESEESAV